MEEKIKMLERIIENNRKQFDAIGVHILLQDDEMEAIEELIKRNRELEEENKKIVQGKFREVADKNSHINDMYIPKSRIQARIDEFEKQIKDCATICAYCKDVMIMKMMQEQIGILRGFQQLLLEFVKEDKQ